MRKLKRRRKVATLGALAVAGTISAGAVIYAANIEMQELQSCIDALGVQVPQPKLSDRILGWVDSRHAERDTRDRKISAVLGEIKKIGSDNPDKVDELVTCIKEGKDYDVSEAGTAALRRVGTPAAKRELYALITTGDRSEADNSIAVYAARQLKEIDPRMAANAIIKRKVKPEKDYRSYFGKLSGFMGVEFYDDLTDILIRTGDIAALNYFMQNKMANELVSFVNRNDSPLLKTYRQQIIQVINNRIYPSGSLACRSEDELLNYGRAIRKLDRSYAEGTAAPEFKSRARFCHYTWRGNFPEGIFLNALLGK